MQSRVLIFYHSASGNTSWIAKKLTDTLKEYGVEVDACNIIHRSAVIDFSRYDLVGFGCPIMGFRPSFAITSFIESLPFQHNVPAFIFTSYTGIRASAPWMLANKLQRQGFVVVAHENFYGEESWPILRTVGLVINRGKPNEQSMPHIKQYAERLSLVIQDLNTGTRLQSSQIPHSRFNLFYYLALLITPEKLRSTMGKRSVDKEQCTQCGFCKTHCAVEAITLNPYPTFNANCTGCWGCFNVCPEGAIKTVVGTKGRYRAKVAYLNDS